MAQMKLWRVLRPGPMVSRPLDLGTETIPEPGSGEMLVRVLASGVCRTDLHVTEGDLPPHAAHVIPGHEVVARWLRRGTPCRVSHPVIEWELPGCGTLAVPADTAVVVRRTLCPNPRHTGWDDDGGYAEFAVVPAGYAPVLPANYSDEEHPSRRIPGPMRTNS